MANMPKILANFHHPVLDLCYGNLSDSLVRLMLEMIVNAEQCPPETIVFKANGKVVGEIIHVVAPLEKAK